MNKWNPDLYLRYADERTQPAYDLIARVNLAQPVNIVDLGCGPGNSARALRERWPAAQILGLDSSQEMIEKARRAYPEGQWLLADVATWQPAVQYSLVFSNATLQWLPDQESLIRRLFAAVEPQGALAVQVPAFGDEPLHQALLRVSHRAAWQAAMAGCDKLLTWHDASFYYDQLSPLSQRFYVWLTTYTHVMARHQDLIDWYAGTGMKSYLDRLAGDELRLRFQREVLEECRADYPAQRDGKILFPFPRLFFLAYKE